MSENINWGDIYDGINLGSHEKINMAQEVLMENIGKRCRILLESISGTLVRDQEGVITDVVGYKNRFRYQVHLDTPVKFSRASSIFECLFIPTYGVEILPLLTCLDPLAPKALTRDEALDAMLKGKKVTHYYFSPGEWITVKGIQIYSEDGVCHGSFNDFLKIREGKGDWSKDWRIFEEKPNNFFR